MNCYTEICKEIDGCFHQVRPLQVLVGRPQYKHLAEKLETDVDWSWVLEAHQRILPLYKLFLLCKIVAEDPVNDRLQLSPTPLIDTLWREHILHVGKYVDMHRVLGLDEKFIDYTTENVGDSNGDKRERIQTLKEYIMFLCPSLVTNATLTSPTPSPSDTPSATSSNKRTRDELGDIRDRSIVPRTTPTRESIDPVPPGSASSNEDRITIGVKQQSGDVIYFKLKRDTLLQRIFDAYAERVGVCKDSLSFFFDGNRIFGHLTARVLELEDDDIIDVHLVQVGC